VAGLVAGAAVFTPYIDFLHVIGSAFLQRNISVGEGPIRKFR
jgi:hypothetical protein